MRVCRWRRNLSACVRAADHHISGAVCVRGWCARMVCVGVCADGVGVCLCVRMVCVRVDHHINGVCMCACG